MLLHFEDIFWACGKLKTDQSIVTNRNEFAVWLVKTTARKLEEKAVTEFGSRGVGLYISVPVDSRRTCAPTCDDVFKCLFLLSFMIVLFIKLCLFSFHLTVKLFRFILNSWSQLAVSSMRHMKKKVGCLFYFDRILLFSGYSYTHTHVYTITL